MTEFEQQILLELIRLEEGEVVTYGTIARRAGRPDAPRAVGRFLAKTQLELPWWRVVNAAGKLHSGGACRQAKLLRTEGVALRQGKVIESPRGDFARLCTATA